MKVQDHSFDEWPCAVRVGIIGLVFFGLVSVAISGATLDTLIDAAGGFAVAIHQQLTFIQGNPGPATLAEKTMEFAKAKTAYFRALRAAIPELKVMATGETARPPELDHLAEAFSLAGGKQGYIPVQISNPWRDFKLVATEERQTPCAVWIIKGVLVANLESDRSRGHRTDVSGVS
jgi:hypothetical protein